MAKRYNWSHPPVKKIEIPDEWLQAANTIAGKGPTSPPPIIFICGGRSSGKATFSRHLVNVLLPLYKKVAYLDTLLDSGEFTPPGFLSLTIVDKENPDLVFPPFTIPERSYFFGDKSLVRNPPAFVEYVHALFNYYKKVYYCPDNSGAGGNLELPLVVKAPRWDKGSDKPVLVGMLKDMSPSHVVKMYKARDTKNPAAGAFWDNELKEITTVIDVNLAPQDSDKLVFVEKDARLQREARIMDYFRQCFPLESNVNTVKELAKGLCELSFHPVPRSEMTIKFLFHENIPDSEVLLALNATLVGLAVNSKESTKDLTQCVGLGLIRGVDAENDELWVITPLPPKDLVKVDVLLRGSINIPENLLKVKGCVSPYMYKNMLDFP